MLRGYPTRHLLRFIIDPNQDLDLSDNDPERYSPRLQLVRLTAGRDRVVSASLFVSPQKNKT
jgi:hypothetical protein